MTCTITNIFTSFDINLDSLTGEISREPLPTDNAASINEFDTKSFAIKLSRNATMRVQLYSYHSLVSKSNEIKFSFVSLFAEKRVMSGGATYVDKSAPQIEEAQ